MRDIRADLRERLEAEGEGLRDLAQQYDDAQARIEALKALLQREEQRIAATQLVTAAAAKVAPPPLDLDTFLIKAAQRGVTEKDDLRDAAIRAGYFNDSAQSPGRVIHATLINLIRDGRLRQTEDGGYVSSNEFSEDPQNRRTLGTLVSNMGT